MFFTEAGITWRKVVVFYVFNSSGCVNSLRIEGEWRMSEMVAFCHLWLVWWRPFIMPSCVCERVCAHGGASVFVCLHMHVFMCVCLRACVSPHLPSGHGFIKHFINVKHHSRHQIKLAHTHTCTLRQRSTHTYKQRGGILTMGWQNYSYAL